MKQVALVHSIENEHTAIIEVLRKSACSGDCHSCKGCSGHHPEQAIRVHAENPIGAKVGDRVWVESESKEVFTSIGIAYILPILLMIGFYFIPLGSEGLQILSSLGGFFLGVAICWLYARRLGQKGTVRAVITGVIR